MFSNYLNFLKFLDYLRNYECLENPYFGDITTVSSDKNGRFLVESDELMLNFENIRNNIFNYHKIKPSTVDGLYFNFDKKHMILSLYFVEFKGSKLSNLSFSYYFESNIIPLIDEQCGFGDDCPINNLNKRVLEKMLDGYSDKISNNLKIKPFESLFIIFPKICEEYANENGLKYSIGDFYSFIFEKIRCHLIVVYKSGENYINDEKTFASDIRDKYKVLKNNGVLNDYKVYDELDFKDNLLKDIEEFPFSFLDIIIPVSENVLNETKNPSKFGSLIKEKLDVNLSKIDLSINDSQKEMLRRVISQCCMDYINNRDCRINNF